MLCVMSFGVNLFMLLEVLRPLEALVTDGADVRFERGMDTKM